MLDRVTTIYGKDEDDNPITTEQPIAHAPILITARLEDIDTRAESLDLRFRRPDGWRHLVVDRGTALDSRKLTQLASCGFPVSSETARLRRSREFTRPCFPKLTQAF
jgi:hypothetical protein